MRRIEVVDYNEQWTFQFIEESLTLRSILGDEIMDIHHIGSTSVPGLQAKPTIDIMIVVRDIHRVDAYNDSMIASGYEARGEFGIAGRRYFPKGNQNRTHHVHIYEQGSPQIQRHLAFRDYLRAHSDQAQQYGELKSQLAQMYPNDRSGCLRKR